jgi:hypothetical protein
LAESKVRDLLRQAMETQLPAGSPVEQVRSILERPDAPGFVQSLNPQVLYQLIQSAGWEEASGMIPLASPWQIQVCLDFDTWHRDQFQVSRLIPWLDTLLSESTDEHFRRVCRETDAEVLAMLFKDSLIVGLFDEDGEPPLEFDGIDWTTSPDGVYAVAYPEDDMGALMRGMVNRLFEVDRVLGWTLLEAARWELFSNMEEEELHWRNSRLEEFGFVGRDEAMEIYRALDPVAFRDNLEKAPLEPKALDRLGRSDLPVLVSRTQDTSYILHIFEELEPEILEALMTELVAVQNRVLIADGIEPGQPEETRGVFERAMGTLSLGLEFVARMDDERAVELVKSVPLRELFRVGYSLQWKLRSTVQQLAQRPSLTIVESERFSLLADQDERAFKAIIKFRPAYVASTGENAGVSEIFATQAQIDDMASRIAYVAFKQLWTFGVSGADVSGLAQTAYGGTLVNDPTTITFDSIFATWVAHVALGKAPSIEGLKVDELSKLPAILRQKPWGEDPLGWFEPAVATAIEAFGAGAARLVSRWLRDTLAELDDQMAQVSDPDPLLLQAVVLIQK